MKKYLLILSLLVVLGVLLYPVSGMSQRGPGYGGWYCPDCGSGYWDGYGYGCGPGMMGRGMGPAYGPRYKQPQKPLDEKEARALVEGNLQASRNPNLKVGAVKDVGNAFEIEILTKNNAIVDKVLVDKYSGTTRSVY